MTKLIVISGLLALAFACSGATAPHESAAVAERPSGEAAPEPAQASKATSAATVSEGLNRVTQVSILDTSQLRSLESQGFGVGMLVEGHEARTTKELSALPGHGSIFRTLRKDFKEVVRQYPTAFPSSVQGARLFEKKFLDSSSMTFALSGVFNRLDRRVFYSQGCGEIRFLYRLGYAIEQGGQPMVERLPMTLNVVFDVDADDCTTVAKEWLAPADLGGDALVAWMLSEGALSKSARSRWRLKAVETNIQTVRFQSTMHPKMAGHIEYFLRVFHPRDGNTDSFVPAPLENTPDLKVLRRNKELRAELLAYLRLPETLERIDLGTLRLPDKFLARRALSVSPRGLARLANRPFKQLYSPTDFADLNLSGHTSIPSPVSLIRRLDVATCQGCHQSRSIAGFHHVGDEPLAEHTFNALFRGSSPHLLGDLKRRESYITAVARGQTPTEFRPFPERQGVAIGAGAPCGLGDSGFAAWACQDDLHCAALEDTEVGLCRADEGNVGDACQYGTMKSGRRPLRDRIENLKTFNCDQGQDTCFQNVAAASQGMCVGECDEVTGAGAICGDFLDIDGFQKCLRQDKSYQGCAKSFVYPLALQRCDENTACRSDYVCTRTRVGEAGACVPSYFIMQLRTDAYPFRR
jgi:hypothetical protein